MSDQPAIEEERAHIEVSEPEHTGVPEVDAILDRLGELEELPVGEHVDLFTDAQRRLHQVLLDAGEQHHQGGIGDHAAGRP